MRRTTWILATAGVVAALTGCGGGPAAPSARQSEPATAPVVEGRLSDVVSQAGTLTYRARPDGSPYIAVNRAKGTFTALPREGEKVRCGHVLYRVDDEPVLLLCGTTPAYRSLSAGDCGPDVRALNAGLGRSARCFSSKTASALEQLWSELGEKPSASLALGQAVLMPGPVRVAKLRATLGGSARPGAPVLEATSGTLQVQLDLDPSRQGEVRKGDRARITLPDTTSVTGRVARLGSVAQAPAGQDRAAGGATLPAYLRLDDPRAARGLDRAPVQVEITTKGVEHALSVPVTAITGRAGGGFAVEAVRAGGRRERVAVQLGLFDTAGGRVQVKGELRAGDRVVVPSP